tara:strand:+ start:426 stop:686 length:261 start_codon:yes stop_codon:yes gene_type:complete
MRYNNAKNSLKENQFKLSQHVKIDIGLKYCILSCSKHRLSDMVETVESLTGKGWKVVPGLTSDDGIVFQSMIKNLEYLENKERSQK